MGFCAHLHFLRENARSIKLQKKLKGVSLCLVKISKELSASS